MDSRTQGAEAPLFPYAADQQGDEWLHIEHSRTADGTTVRLAVRGELERTTTELLRRCADAVMSHSAPATLEIETSGLSLLDSSGVHCLLVCRALVAAAGGRMILVDPAPNVHQVLEITGLLELFGIARQPTPTYPMHRGGHHEPLTMQEISDQSAQLRQDARALRQYAAEACAEVLRGRRPEDR